MGVCQSCIVGLKMIRLCKCECTAYSQCDFIGLTLCGSNVGLWVCLSVVRGCVYVGPWVGLSVQCDFIGRSNVALWLCVTHCVCGSSWADMATQQGMQIAPTAVPP